MINSESNHNQEPSHETEVKDSILQAHDDFLRLVPNYASSAWNPETALKTRQGSCMAELLFVVGTLLNDKKIQPNDATIGFSTSHGQKQDIGFVGKSEIKFAHPFLFISVSGSRTLECGFREFSAEQKPQIKILDSLVPYVDEAFVLPLESAIKTYASLVGQEPLNIEDLIRIASEESVEQPNQVRFDEEF